MNYQKLYDSIIDRARFRVLDGYTESHHILPKCVGGTNDLNNLARLTPEEHFVCHQLLLRIYRGTAHSGKMAFACHMMTVQSAKQHVRNGSKLKEFGWLRKEYSVACANNQRGKLKTEEHRKNLSIANTGKKEITRESFDLPSCW